MKKQVILISFAVFYALAFVASVIILSTGKNYEKNNQEALGGLGSLAKMTQKKSESQIGIITMNGPISFMSGGTGLLSSKSQGATYWLEQLNYAETNNSIKAVVIYVNSPGGTVGASQELNAAVKRIQKVGKPVITSVMDMSASGGYYATVSSDRIFANPGSLIGSIGVIIGGLEYSRLLETIGIRYQAITSGVNKDLLSPYKNLTEEQREFLQTMINNTYNQFLSAVVEGRKRSIQEIKPYADGSVFTGEQAVDIGLVDEIGSQYDALKYTKDFYALQDASVVEISPKSSKNFDFIELLSVLSPKDFKVSINGLKNSFSTSPILYMYEF